MATHVIATVVKVDRRNRPTISDDLHIQLRLETEIEKAWPAIAAEIGKVHDRSDLR